MSQTRIVPLPMAALRFIRCAIHGPGHIINKSRYEVVVNRGIRETVRARVVRDMSKAVLELLDRDDEDQVHERTVQVLSEVGVLIRSGSVLSMLGEHGALVDPKTGVAKIPEGLVAEALRKAPKQFAMCARNPSNDIRVPGGGPHLTTDGLTLYMVEDDTGESRDANRIDFSEFARLAEALPAIDFFWPIVTISDVPTACHSEYELWTGLQNCSMHVQGDCTSAVGARKQIELAALVAGGEDELRKRPLFSSATNPISPLSFDKGAVEAQVEFARAGIPILCHSMSMSGMSAPVTVSGTVLNVNAENLASLVISQCASPGAPHIYGSASAPADMRTGALDLVAPEGLLIAAAAGQMARRYGRPCMVANWGVGRNGPGFKISFTEALAYIGSVLSGSDLVSGAGGLDSAKGCSMAQMVLDSYIWDNFRGFLRDVDFSDLASVIEAYKGVGHGNSFLSSPHTARSFRKELFTFDQAKLALERTQSDQMLPDLRNEVKRVLSEGGCEALDRDVSERGEAMLRAHAKSFSS
jgi:trimethylamine--corrinoid protein Co-methyltransferase